MVSNGDQTSEAVRDENSGSERDGEEVVLNVDPEEFLQDHQDQITSSVAKCLDSADAVLPFFWWIIGFFWIYVVGQNLSHDSAQLYWLCVTFLVFDAFIVVIYIFVECVVGLAICVCLPCMLSILYSMTDQEEEIEDCIQSLPKYKFQRTGVFYEKQIGDSQNEEIQESPREKMIECNTNKPTEHVLSLEDAVNGNVLRRLPCHHHFHSACIGRWLYLHATCLLCKANVLNYVNYIGGDQV
ncbi:RING-type domain-containing protein [Heracleum sosnowskyi]|uniref:RING-type E3 ubiquitin transferase n=1 Tax=Heracleum sosnowskyi TaxID=360622 RepID=A0AAD8H4P3_9APIA|nr:RING-type domain-containing protein [Heracleum sosnowskyi]